jgi:steroid delta-isomerase-like uncharacterized protein
LEFDMSNDPTTAVATRFYEQFSQGHIGTIIEQLGDGYVSHGFGGGGGPDNLRQSLQMMRNAFPDLTFTIEDTITEGDKVAVKATLRGTHQGLFAGRRASGNSVEVGSCDVFRVRDGRLVEAWWLGDSGSMFMQIGAIPAPNSG